MKVYHSLSENMLTVNMLLSVFFLSGVSADRCDGFTPTFFSTTPKSIVALSGSCLKVPCSFTVQAENDFNSGGQTFAAWIPSSRNIFEISQGFNNNQISITGNIKQRNCTTVFSDIKSTQETEYFLRIENSKFRSTACSTPLQFTVQDSPEKPRIEPDLKDLKEHQSVTVTCSAFTPCPHSPPELTWNLQQDSLRQTEKNTNGTLTTKIQENITLSDTHDGYNIRCSARYPVIGGNKTAETEVTLSVSYAPRNTSASISPSGLVSAGSWVELSCSSRAKPPPSFTWFRISEHGATNVSMEQVYKLQMTNMSNIESHFCVAANILGNQTTSWSHLKNKETGMLTVSGSVILLLIFAGLICLVSSVLFFKSKHRTHQQPQAEPDEDVTVQMPPDKTEDEPYEDMNFIQSRPEAFSESIKNRGPEEAVYAQVKKFRARNCSVQTADSSEDTYIEMKHQ